MPKPPIAERIKALEAFNVRLLDKISRMKAQVRHNNECIRKWKRRQDRQELAALQEELDQRQADELQQRRLQSERDRQRTKDMKAAKYREDMEQRLHDCRVMNGLEHG